MKNNLKLILMFVTVSLILFSGCTQLDSNNQNKQAGCPTTEEVDQLEMEFLSMRDELVSYLNDTELILEPSHPTYQQGNLTDKGREMRLDYEELRGQYIEVANNGCKKTDGSTLEGGSAIWLKGYDLTKNEIHPEYFLGLPVFNKFRYTFEEPDYWTGETTDYIEYEYIGNISDYKVVAKIFAEYVGTVEDQWKDLADTEGFQKAEYGSGEPVGSTIYYTNFYQDDYGRQYKGIYFQIFLFKVYAGYYGDTSILGTDPEYFDGIVFTEDDAKEIYEYLVYTPK